MNEIILSKMPYILKGLIFLEHSSIVVVVLLIWLAGTFGFAFDSIRRFRKNISSFESLTWIDTFWLSTGASFYLNQFLAGLISKLLHFNTNLIGILFIINTFMAFASLVLCIIQIITMIVLHQIGKKNGYK